MSESSVEWGITIMTARVIKAMMLIVEWDNMEKFCRKRDGIGCDGCPYDLGTERPCDRKTTVYVMETAAEIFRDYIKGN